MPQSSMTQELLAGQTPFHDEGIADPMAGALSKSVPGTIWRRCFEDKTVLAS